MEIRDDDLCTVLARSDDDDIARELAFSEPLANLEPEPGPAEEKQRVLELRTESSRLSAIIDLLARGLQALAQIEQIRERAQTNGKVPHGE